MPELPEVETIRRILDKFVDGKTISNIAIYREKSILTGAKEFSRSLIGQTFKKVTREGKFLIFHLSNDYVVISHLRMEGKYLDGTINEAPYKHDIFRYEFNDGTTLRFNDVRKFGIVMLTNEINLHSLPPLSTLGAEPFSLKAEDLYAGLQKRKHTPIKEALLDQTLIAGLGNIYDDEVLYASHINPKRNASSISLKECQSILKESIRILNEAIENGGSTIRSYHPKAGVSGNMQNHLLAYGRGGKPCLTCGAPLRKISIGGRGTVYCPFCQVNYGEPFIVGVTGPIASGKSSVSSYLESLGYYKIDADEEIEKCYEDKDVQEQVILAFGPEAFIEQKLNRPYILKMVASDPLKKTELENILYPTLYRNIDKKIAHSPSDKVVLDVPLLIGSPLEERCDYIIALLVDEEVQKKRIEERGKDVEASLALNKKWPKRQAKSKATLLLDGNGSLDNLLSQVKKATYLTFKYDSKPLSK
jgi:formamidopyrimidine-DNA glycosylase